MEKAAVGRDKACLVSTHIQDAGVLEGGVHALQHLCVHPFCVTLCSKKISRHGDVALFYKNLEGMETIVK